MVLSQTVFVFVLAFSTQAIEYHGNGYFGHEAYHHVQPAPPKTAISFASITTHHSPRKIAPLPLAPIHQSVQIFAAPVLTSHTRYAPASPYAPFSPPARTVEHENAVSVFQAYNRKSVQHQPIPVVQVNHHVPVPVPVSHEVHRGINYYANHPQYSFKYGVNDENTNDKKYHHEQRNGDHTQGQYAVREPDGTVLTVDYSVAGKSGFNAVVHRAGQSVHPYFNLH